MYDRVSEGPASIITALARSLDHVWADMMSALLLTLMNHFLLPFTDAHGHAVAGIDLKIISPRKAMVLLATAHNVVAWSVVCMLMLSV